MPCRRPNCCAALSRSACLAPLGSIAEGPQSLVRAQNGMGLSTERPRSFQDPPPTAPCPSFGPVYAIASSLCRRVLQWHLGLAPASTAFTATTGSNLRPFLSFRPPARNDFSWVLWLYSHNRLRSGQFRTKAHLAPLQRGEGGARRAGDGRVRGMVFHR